MISISSNCNTTGDLIANNISPDNFYVDDLKKISCCVNVDQILRDYIYFRKYDVKTTI